jgi:hypothetical protein
MQVHLAGPLAAANVCFSWSAAVTGVWSLFPHRSNFAALTCSALRDRQQIVPGTCSSCCTLLSAVTALCIAHTVPGTPQGPSGQAIQRGAGTLAQLQAAAYYLHSHLCAQECMAVLCWAPWLRVQVGSSGVCLSPAGSQSAANHAAACTQQQARSQNSLCMCLPVACGSGLWWGWPN